MDKQYYMDELASKYYSAVNGVRVVTTEIRDYIFVNGKATLGDYYLAMAYTTQNELSEITIKHGGGVVVVSVDELQNIIDLMVADGYEIWLEKVARETELDALDATAEDFDSLATEIVERDW